MKDLKRRIIRGGFAKVCGQGLNALLRVGSLMVMMVEEAPLFTPRD